MTATTEPLTTLTDAVDRFSGYLKREEGLSPATIAQYRADCTRLAGWLAAQRPQVSVWADVKEADIRRFVDQHDPEPARGRRLLSSWRKLWTYLSDVEKVDMHRGPFAVKRKKLKRLQPKYLTPSEVSRLVSAVQGRSPEQQQRNRAVIMFLYGSGCRISEVLSLQLDAVEFDEDGQPQKIRVLGKGEKERTIYLSPTAQRALSDWLRRKRQEGETGPYVFSYLTGTRRGEPVQARTIERAVKEAGARAGLPDERCTPHKLRHSHATALMKAGRRLEEVQEILGHESIATTRIYAHLEPGRLAAAAASLPDVL